MVVMMMMVVTIVVLKRSQAGGATEACARGMAQERGGAEGAVNFISSLTHTADYPHSPRLSFPQGDGGGGEAQGGASPKGAAAHWHLLHGLCLDQPRWRQLPMRGGVTLSQLRELNSQTRKGLQWGSTFPLELVFSSFIQNLF
jgi:hypothetical protein